MFEGPFFVYFVRMFVFVRLVVIFVRFVFFACVCSFVRLCLWFEEIINCNLFDCFSVFQLSFLYIILEKKMMHK